MILRGTVFSETLQMDTGIAVVTPLRYNPEGNYKVVYLLHGLCGNHANWLDNTMLNVYATEYNAVFVMPEVYRSYYTDMRYGGAYFTYIADELPQICKSTFRISAGREDTAVIGASMGGYGALKCALSRPEQYGHCAALSSGCLFLKEGMALQREKGLDDPELNAMFGRMLLEDFVNTFGEELEWKADYEVMDLARKVDAGTAKPRIYAACGTEDMAMLEPNRRLAQEMKATSLDFTYEEWAGGHDWRFFDRALEKSLAWCL